MSNYFEIARHEGPTKTVISVSLTEDGGISVDGWDLGEAPMRTWGHDDYEYGVKVPASEIGRLLLLLLKEKYDGNIGAVEDFREFCKSRGIVYQWESWP